MNPWKEVPLRTYESHMALPEVGQARMLSDAFFEVVNESSPNSLALLGCAGGNGLSALKERELERVVCIDINEEYISSLKGRFKEKLPALECHCTELETFRSDKPVDLIFAGLIFEYTKLEEALDSVSTLAEAGTLFYTILQLKSDAIPTVSSSPYTSELMDVSDFFNYVDEAEFVEQTQKRGFSLLSTEKETLESGKSFQHIKLKRIEQGSSGNG